MMTYDKIKAVNWSTLKCLATSPMLYRYRLEHPEPSKPSYALGNAVHTLALEPQQFHLRYAEFDGTRRGKSWDDWQDEHPGQQSLKPDEMAEVRVMADRILTHRVAARVLSGGRREEVTTWTDAGTGLACKGRLDYTRPDRIADLKTTRAIAPRDFSRAVASYMYHGQLAFYHDGAIAAGKIPSDAPAPWIVAAQNMEPYDVAVYAMSDAALWAGRQLYRSLLEKLVACTEADMWPGIAPDEIVLDVPSWAPGVYTDQEEF